MLALKVLSVDRLFSKIKIDDHWQSQKATFFAKYDLEAAEEDFRVKKSSIHKGRKPLKENQRKLGGS